MDIKHFKLAILAKNGNRERAILEEYMDLQTKREELIESTNRYLRPHFTGKDWEVIFDPESMSQVEGLAAELDVVEDRLRRLEGMFQRYEKTVIGGDSTDRLAHRKDVLEHQIKFYQGKAKPFEPEDPKRKEFEAEVVVLQGELEQVNLQLDKLIKAMEII